MEYVDETVFWKTQGTIKEIKAFKVELNKFIKENKIWTTTPIA